MEKMTDSWVENIEPHLYQRNYIWSDSIWDLERVDRVKNIASMLGRMNKKCRLSVCIPAYRESGIINNTLEHYTVNQFSCNSERLDPDIFEINILVNRPNEKSEQDVVMMEEIYEFIEKHSEYHINVADVVYDFPSKPVIWLIFKDIADAVILRNLCREDVSDTDKSRLILRTAGADVEALNPFLLSRTISIFSDPSVVAHRWETRLPPEVLQSFPLLHVMQTLAVFLLRQYHGNQTTNGPFSYSAEAYARVWWFNPEKALWEEIDLAKRIWKITQDFEGQLRFIRDLVKDVLNNPRRQVHALLEWAWMAARYQNFWKVWNENDIRDMSLSWKSIGLENLPSFCLITPENLSREVSAYYRTYIRIAQTNDTPQEDIDMLFIKGFRLSGITEYSIHKSTDVRENHIEIHNIDGLLNQLKKQTFSWGKHFIK